MCHLYRPRIKTHVYQPHHDLFIARQRQRALQVLQSSSRNSTHRRQGDLLEIHPCVLQDIPGNSSCFQRHSRHSSHSRHYRDIPVHSWPSSLPGNSTMFQYLQGIPPHFQHSPIRMHILQFDWFPQKTPTEYQLGNYRHYIHSSKKGRCCDIGQIDRFSIIELFPLSSCQMIILIARMTFNCFPSCLMS